MPSNDVVGRFIVYQLLRDVLTQLMNPRPLTLPRNQLATAAPIMYNYDGEKFSHTNHQSKWKLDKPQFLTSTLKLSHGDSLV